MTPAQIRRHRRLKSHRKRPNLILPLLTLIAIVSLLAVIYFFAKPRFWDGASKMSMVTSNGQNITVINFDPALDQITAIDIPGNTQVEVSRSLGTWKLGSVFKLGRDENLDSELLRETVVKNFNFPIAVWSDANPNFYLNAKVSNFLKVFSPVKTNLSLVDRVKIFLFAIQVENAKVVRIDLARTSMLKQTVLADGSKGYILTKLSLPEFIGVFANNFSDTLLSVSIKDVSGDSKIAPAISNIIDYTGAKVVSNREETQTQDDCVVTSKNKILIKEMSDILGCRVNNENPNGNFDMEIMIGETFASRF